MRSSLARYQAKPMDAFKVKKEGWHEQDVAIFSKEQIALLPQDKQEMTLAEAITIAANFLYGTAK